MAYEVSNVWLHTRVPAYANTTGASDVFLWVFPGTAWFLTGYWLTRSGAVTFDTRHGSPLFADGRSRRVTTGIFGAALLGVVMGVLLTVAGGLRPEFDPLGLLVYTAFHGIIVFLFGGGGVTMASAVGGHVKRKRSYVYVGLFILAAGVLLSLGLLSPGSGEWDTGLFPSLVGLFYLGLWVLGTDG